MKKYVFYMSSLLVIINAFLLIADFDTARISALCGWLVAAIWTSELMEGK